MPDFKVNRHIFKNVSHIKPRIMIPRIVLEPSLLWFLYVAPNKEFFVLDHSGPLWCLCFYKTFYLSDTLAWPGPGVDCQSTVQQVDSLTALETGENKNSNKTNINLISESPRAVGSVYQCFDFVH